MIERIARWSPTLSGENAGLSGSFSFLRCFFGSVSLASDASSSPIRTAMGRGMLLEVVTGRRGDDHAVGHSSFSSAMTSSRV